MHVERAKRGWHAVYPLCPQCNRALWHGGEQARPEGEAEFTCDCGWVGMASLDLEWYVRQALADAGVLA